MALQEMAGVDITGLFEGDIVDGCFEVIYPELNDGKEERTGNAQRCIYGLLADPRKIHFQ